MIDEQTAVVIGLEQLALDLAVVLSAVEPQQRRGVKERFAKFVNADLMRIERDARYCLERWKSAASAC
jgi:hypothetical protein